MKLGYALVARHVSNRIGCIVAHLRLTTSHPQQTFRSHSAHKNGMRKVCKILSRFLQIACFFFQRVLTGLTILGVIAYNVIHTIRKLWIQLEGCPLFATPKVIHIKPIGDRGAGRETATGEGRERAAAMQEDDGVFPTEEIFCTCCSSGPCARVKGHWGVGEEEGRKTTSSSTCTRILTVFRGLAVWKTQCQSHNCSLFSESERTFNAAVRHARLGWRL